MSKIIHTVPAPAASMSFGHAFTEPKPQAAELHPDVEEMCAHLLQEKLRELERVPKEYHANILPPVYINDIGHRRLCQTREDFERLLRPWQYELGKLMQRVPRDDLTIDAYLTRLTRAGSGDGWWNHFHRMKNFLAHLHRIEQEEAAERQRERDAEEARKRAERQRRRQEEEREREARRQLERDASPDKAEIKRLLAVIAEAKDIEELLALHEAADDARGALQSIYTKERDACAALGKPAPERSVPGWPNALEVTRRTKVSSPVCDVPRPYTAPAKVRHG
jgi:hypothetical protein